MKKKKNIISYLLSLILILTSLPIPTMATETRNTTTNNILIKETNQQSTTSGAIEIDSNTYIGNGYNVKFEITNQWPNAFTANIVITNTGDKALENWSLGFDFAHEISNIWNAQIVSHQGNSYIIKNVTSNQDIAVGESITIGIQATCTDEISVPKQYNLLIEKQQVTNEDYTINFKIINDWETGFNGEISITNNTKETIEDWILEFDFDREIERFWTAEIQQHEGEHYIVKNSGYNANISAGETLVLGFSGSPGKVNSEPQNYILNKIRIGQEVDYEKDTDGDKLPDYYEKILGTDFNKEDTDGDSLPDGYEHFYLQTNPTLQDTDENDIIDSEEDFDNDKLTNIEEYKLGTNPYSNDTDGDHLEDWEEIYTYKTNPLVADTDGDGINDDDEVKLGLDPLNKYTYGVLDSEYQIEQIIPSNIIDLNQEEDKYQLSLDIVASGCVENNLYVLQSPYYEAMSANTAILGNVLELSYDAGIVSEATLRFKINEPYVENTSTQNINDNTLNGIKRYNIFKYFKDDNLLLPISTDFDEENNTVVAKVSSLGTYCIVDLEMLIDDWGISDEEEITENTYVNMDTSILKTNNVNLDAPMLQSRVVSNNLVSSTERNFSSMNASAKSSNYNLPAFIGAYGEYEDRQYALLDPSSGGISWIKAKETCEKLGGHLVTITSKEEQDFIIKNLLPYGRKYMYWIGGDDISGKWKWLTNEGFEYTNWNDNNSPKINENYLQMYRATKDGFTAGKWKAQDCFGTKDGTKYDIKYAGYICEWENLGKKFKYISANGLKSDTLNSDLKKFGKTNSDKDSLTDSQEVNWELMEDDGKLPSLQTLIRTHKKGYVEDGLDDVENILAKNFGNNYEARQKFLNTPVLPLLSDPKKEDGDGDGIWDDDDPNKLRKDTIETMFKLSHDNDRSNNVYMEINNNTIDIYLRIVFSSSASQKYKDLTLKGIKDSWENIFSGNEYDFFPGIKGKVNVYFEIIDGNPVIASKLYNVIEIGIGEFGQPMSVTAATGWNMNSKYQKISLYKTAWYISSNEKVKLSDPRFSEVAAHEIGHCLGLWDAYPDANLWTENEPADVTILPPSIRPSVLLDPNVEVDEDSIMWYGTKATSNDIEMVLQAFVKNKQQHYYASTPYSKSEVVRCPQVFK